MLCTLFRNGEIQPGCGWHTGTGGQWGDIQADHLYNSSLHITVLQYHQYHSSQYNTVTHNSSPVQYHLYNSSLYNTTCTIPSCTIPPVQFIPVPYHLYNSSLYNTTCTTTLYKTTCTIPPCTIPLVQSTLYNATCTLQFLHVHYRHTHRGGSREVPVGRSCLPTHSPMFFGYT